MSHPFGSVPSDRRGRYFWHLVVLAVLTMVILNLVGSPLTTAAAPVGIISFEFAGNVSQAEKILSSWDAEARQRAAFVQGLDFLFIPIYAGAIAFGCLMASGVFRTKGWAMASLGENLAWLVLLAGLLDIIENYALVVMLFDVPANPWPQVAFWCAAPKFIFVAVGILYTLLGGLVYIFSRRK